MILHQIFNTVAEKVKVILKERGVEEEGLGFVVERPREEGYGDFATNAPFLLSPLLKESPKEIASELVRTLSSEKLFEKVEAGGAGFVNFFVSREAWSGELKKILEEGSAYGTLDTGRNLKIQVEFVSANPVGPMHIGHGRWAAIGDSLSRLLEKAGYAVEREFYINDAGRQMDLFAESVACRYSEIYSEKIELPEEGYRGAYIKEIATEIAEKFGERYMAIPYEERKKEFGKIAYEIVLEHLKSVLARMDVEFDVWFSEKSLHREGKILQTVDTLRKKDYIYEKDGAVWLKSTEFEDEKDRVLIRSNGESTYFTADIAYHINKRERGFQKVIDIWGADHHGYVKRMQAAMKALGYPDDFLEIIIGQMVNLYSGGKPVRMSKRTGEMVTLEELLDDVGKDALRFFFCSKSTDSTLDFDIDLAKEQSQRNPVYYVQYAHARICSILKFAASEGIEIEKLSVESAELISNPYEIKLVKELSKFPEIVDACIRTRSVHFLTDYLIGLATEFHSFYTECRVVQAEPGIRDARLLLCLATRTVIAEGLSLLGVSTPQTM